MKKYFLKGVDEPLEFGDTIEFDVEKGGDDGQSVTKHVKTDFIPEIIPVLLDLDVIEEKEQPIDFTDDKEEEKSNDTDGNIDEFIHTVELLYTVIGQLIKKVDKLEEKVNSLKFKDDFKKDGDSYVPLKDYIKSNLPFDIFLHNLTASSVCRFL